MIYKFIKEIPLGAKITFPERKQQDKVSQQHANGIAEFDVTSSHFYENQQSFLVCEIFPVSYTKINIKDEMRLE